MNFPVPWRALLPADAIQVVTGGIGTPVLKEMCDQTGAFIEISGEGETPSTLSDKICTISGSVEQKEAATRRIVDRLRGLQEVGDQEPGVFVIIVPSIAAPAVVGQKGSQIKEVIELSGAEISVGKENIIGMADQPIGITGTGGQVVSAVSKINAILQDLADRGRLQPSDFKYRPGAINNEPGYAGTLGPGGPRAAPPSGGNPRTHAKFVAPTQVAGWIIGKQGRHIRELQENSGAHIQIHREGDVPPGVPPSDRVIEIGGRPDAKAEGVQIVLMAIDSMPALQAPRETSMLVPKALTTPGELEDARRMSGCEVEVRDLPGHDEALCTLVGTIEARVKAAQHFLTRLEEASRDGRLGAEAQTWKDTSAPAAPARPSREEPRREPTFSQPARVAEEPRREPTFSQLARVAEEPRRESTFSQPARVAEEPRREPTFSQLARVAEEPRREPTFSQPARVAEEPRREPSLQPVLAEDSRECEGKKTPKTVSFRESEVLNYNVASGASSPCTPNGDVGKESHMAPQNQITPQPQHQHGETRPQQQQQPPEKPRQEAQPHHYVQQPQARVGGTLGTIQMAFTLDSSRIAQLHLVLSSELLSKALVPHGHLAEIAQKCQVRIDLGDEISLGVRQVSLTGSIAANAVAAYFLQERAAQHSGLGGIIMNARSKT